MRNLTEYPITDDEVINVLQTLKDEIQKEQRLGDIRPLCLQKAIERMLTSAGSSLR